VLVVSTAVVLVNFLVDSLYGVLDPRISTSTS
jgi:ABC-type dipeptide/oligopeptide/nickel transport system permease component